MNSSEKLSTLLESLPGVGEKTASRFAAFIARQPTRWISDLSEALLDIGDATPCTRCCAPADAEECDICAARKNSESICVVESESDIHAIEAIGCSHTYHVLGGVLSPLDGIGPEDINLSHLLDRVKEEHPKEIILALAPSVEADATAMYIARILDEVPVTRIARGLPIGSQVEHTDSATLAAAFQRRSAE